jgi:ribulose-bisphosphate carboxylase large chain
MPEQRIIADYLVETPLSLEQAAESMTGEQSTGTFTRCPARVTSCTSDSPHVMPISFSLEATRPNLPHI